MEHSPTSATGTAWGAHAVARYAAGGADEDRREWLGFGPSRNAGHSSSGGRGMLTRSIGIAVLAVLALASSSAADPLAPFAQSSLPHSLDCTPPGIPPFADTGLSATFETKTN